MYLVLGHPFSFEHTSSSTDFTSQPVSAHDTFFPRTQIFSMGTGRDNGRSAKKDRDAAWARKYQRRHAAAASAGAPSQVGPLKADPPHTDQKKKNRLLVRKLVPKAGMIYFRTRYFLVRERRDRALGVAMRKAFRFVTKPLLNERFAHMFEAATEVQQQHVRQWENLSPQFHAASRFDSDTFFNSLRHHHSVQPWAQHVSQSLLTSLFMNLRAARLSWHRTPQNPLNVAEHSVLAKAIDAFNAADILSWSTDAPFLGWIIGGGPGFHTKKAIITANNSMDVEDEHDKRTTMDVNINSGNERDLDDGTSANLAGAILAGEEMEGIITHADNIFQLTYDQVVESMRLLSIEVDVPSLIEAFARHNLDDDDVQAANWRKAEADFFDDLDVNMVL